MGQGPTGKYLGDLEAAFGKGKVTSGYRSQETQDDLVRRGKTRATRSSHTYADGYDLAIDAASSPEEVRRIAASRGLTVGKVIRETGKGRNQGTGPHWHVELASSGGTPVASQNGAGGAYNSSKPGQGVANPQAYLADLESSLGPEAKSSGEVRQNSETIFGSDAELKKRGGAVEEQLVRQGNQIEVLDDVMMVAQLETRNAMARQIDQTRDISDQIVAGTEELKKKVIPVFQARGRIADQLDKISEMNPIERGIRGIFDMNYDDDYLEGRLDQFDRTLKARSDDFDYLNKLHGVALQEIGRRYELDTGMSGLAQKQAEEDLGLTGMRITQTSGMLGALRDRISTESQLISAKAMAREDLMGRLDIPTVTDLMTKAQQNGGMIQYNGVEFSYKELRNRIQMSEQQDLQTEAYKMSIAGGRMDMATKYAENLARSLTRQQLEGAINNGGVYNGVQLPQDVLTNLYQGAISRDETRANVVAREMPAKLAMDTAASHLNQVTGLYSRSKSLFGNQAMEGSAPFTDRAGALVRRLTQAVQSGEPPEVVAALTQQIAQNSEGYTKFVDDRILRQVGGDKRAAGYLKGFVYGSQLSPGTAAEALTYFAMKGNLPEGVSLSPEARQVFQKAQRLVMDHRGGQVGGKPISEQQLMGIVQRDLTGSAAQIMGQARHDKVYADLPSVARLTQHPFGKFNGERWAQIRSEASMTAAEAIARGVNTTPQNVIRMMRTGKPLSGSEADKKLYGTVTAKASDYNGVEMTTTVRLLDLERQIQPGSRNSDLMSDFLGSPKFATGLSSYSQSLGSQTMGEYLVNPLTQGAVERNFIETRDSVLDAQSSNYQADRQFAQNPSSALIMQPRKRSAMILESIPGVGKEGARGLAPFVDQVFDKEFKEDRHWYGLESPNNRFMREDGKLYAALQGAKFEDPKMEAWRRATLKGWQESATAQQGFVSRLIDGIFGDEGRVSDAEFAQKGNH